MRGVSNKHCLLTFFIVVDSLFIVAHIVSGVLCLVLVFYVVVSVLSSFVINLMRKRELVALL